MSPNRWTVDVDGGQHTVAVEVDSQSRRAAIRVDGRMASKPMTADETEREIQVGSARYLVRRLADDKFELDIPPEVFLNRATSGGVPGQRRPGVKPPPKEKKSRLGMTIGGVVVALIVVGLVRYGLQGLQYMRVPWQPYAAPDGSFKVNFPGNPTSSEHSENINGDIWTVRSLFSTHKNHFYAVEYVDLKMVVLESNVQPVMSEFLHGWAQAIGGSVMTTEKTSLLRNQALNFVISLPAGAGSGEKRLPVPARMRGISTIRGSRLFIAWTLAAASDPFATDLRQFTDSFQVSPPPPSATFEAVNRQTTVREVPAAATAPPPEPATDTAAEAARIAAETAARRAAQPQIYLETAFRMFHVEGCKAVTPDMKRVSIEERPYGYAAHICVPDEVRNWRKTK